MPSKPNLLGILFWAWASRWWRCAYHRLLSQNRSAVQRAYDHAHDREQEALAQSDVSRFLPNMTCIRKYLPLNGVLGIGTSRRDSETLVSAAPPPECVTWRTAILKGSKSLPATFGVCVIRHALRKLRALKQSFAQFKMASKLWSNSPFGYNKTKTRKSQVNRE